MITWTAIMIVGLFTGSPTSVVVPGFTTEQTCDNAIKEINKNSLGQRSGVSIITSYCIQIK